MSTITQEAKQAVVNEAAKPQRIEYDIPAVSIHEDADGYTIEAELPGVGKENVGVTLTGGELVFTGTKGPRPAGTRVYGELSHADYRRVFDLDPAVDTSKITAKMEQGLLLVRLPKAQERKPRRIAVAG